MPDLLCTGKSFQQIDFSRVEGDVSILHQSCVAVYHIAVDSTIVRDVLCSLVLVRTAFSDSFLVSQYVGNTDTY